MELIGVLEGLLFVVDKGILDKIVHKHGSHLLIDTEHKTSVFLDINIQRLVGINFFVEFHSIRTQLTEIDICNIWELAVFDLGEQQQGLVESDQMLQAAVEFHQFFSDISVDICPVKHDLYPVAARSKRSLEFMRCIPDEYLPLCILMLEPVDSIIYSIGKLTEFDLKYRF